MILNFKIAKHRHGDAEDAKALEPLIATADVVSLENTGGRENEIRVMESWYKEFKTSAKRERRQIKELFYQPSEYGKEITRIILKYAKPVVFLERCTDEEARALERVEKLLSGEEDINVFQLFFKGNAEEAMRSAYSIAEKARYFTTIRDNIMARSGLVIAERIVELYPSLGERQSLDYLICIGGAHSPERGLKDVPDSTVKVIEAPDSRRYTQWKAELFSKAVGGASYEECREDAARMIISAAFRVAVPKECSKTVELSHLVAGTMGSRELEEMTSRIDPSSENDQKLEVIRGYFEEKGVVLPKSRKEYGRLIPKYRRMAGSIK